MKNTNLLVVLGIALLCLFLWEHWIIYPIKLLVVLMHETGHALAAMLTGGDVVSIRISPQQGGVAVTRGGIRFIILCAGYLGSSLIGAALLALSARKPWKHFLLELFGGVILLELVFWVRDLFTAVFVIGVVVGLYFLSKLSTNVKPLVMQVIGTMCCLYAVYDIKSDILSGQSWYGGGAAVSDAQALAGITFIPAIVWGIFWIALAIGIFVVTWLNLPEDDRSNIKSISSRL